MEEEVIWNSTRGKDRSGASSSHPLHCIEMTDAM